MITTLSKHHGLGNDFLVALDLLDELDLDELSALAVAWCDRRRGIGADGLLVGGVAEGYDARMVLFNADGSRAEMSGNGIRCFGHAIAVRSGSLADQRITTDAGTRVLRLVRSADLADSLEVSVDMGEVRRIGPPSGWEALGCHPDRPVLHLSLGNPHSVVGVDDVTEVDLLALGTKVPTTNLEIIEPGEHPAEIRMRVHERGAGITSACGTGACASAHAAVAWGLVPSSISEITVRMDGGCAKVRLDDPAPGHVTLIGPSTFVATITVEHAAVKRAMRGTSTT